MLEEAPSSRTFSFAQYRKIVVLTGAGISVASGIRPFRGEGGLQEEIDLQAHSDASSLKTHPAAIWTLYGGLRRQLRLAQPNPAHIALAQFEKQLLAGQQFTLITQNVDGLHQQAGSCNVVELHGTAKRTRCSNPECSLESYPDLEPHDKSLPFCPVCRSVLRPDLVLFSEMISVEAEWRAKQALRDCDLFIAIGTSGTVSPAANFVRSADYAGARTILLNWEPMTPQNPYFKEEHLGRAEELVPKSSLI